MRKRPPIALMVALALGVGLALAPAAALAGTFLGRPGASAGIGRPVAVARPVVPHRFGTHRLADHRFMPHPFANHRFPPHGFARQPFVPFFHRPVAPVTTTTVILFASPPPFFYGAPAYAAPPVASDPPAVPSPPVVYTPSPVYTAPVSTASVAPSPPPPPMPSVVEYPTGRYELRGDGLTTAYTWVWIPNPPAAPPSGPPGDAPAPAPAPAGPPAAAPPPRSSQLYSWTDEHQVVHWTNRADAVPERYRAQAPRPTPF